MSNDVTQKFYSDPARATDLDRGSFFVRKSIIDDVAKWSEGLDQRDPTNNWIPILYRYEVRVWWFCSGVDLADEGCWLSLDRQDVC